MKLKEIRFHERSGSGIPGLWRLLPGGYWVSKQVFELAWSQVDARFSALDWRVQQTAESLCGEAFWKTHACGKRIALGRCVKYFVDHEMLPLRVANPRKKGKRKYVRA